MKHEKLMSHCLSLSLSLYKVLRDFVRKQRKHVVPGGRIYTLCQLMKAHPVPSALLSISPWIGVAGYNDVAIGCIAGAVVYILLFNIDRIAVDVLDGDD